MPLDYESATSTRTPSTARFCLVAFGGAAAGVLGWCVLDFVLVKFAPSQMHDFDWMMILFPFIVGGAGLVLLRRPDSPPPVALAIVAAIVASILAAVLIPLIGVPFHFAIGGKL